MHGLPLAGRCLLVTRSLERAASLQEPLESLGAEVALLPCLEIGPPRDWAPLDAAIEALDGFHWIVFTSPNAVTYVLDRVAERGLDARALDPLRVAAVGPATAQALRHHGLEPDLVAQNHTQEGLVEAFDGVEVAGSRLLIPASAIGRALLDEHLTRRGGQVVRVAAYENRAPAPGSVEVPARLREGRLDMIVFASPSAVQHFAQILGEDRAADLMQHTDLACIGPTTAKALADRGLSAAVQPVESAVPALVEAIRRHYEEACP